MRVPNRWRLLAAVTGSLLLHALVLLGSAPGRAPTRPADSGNMPIRAHLIVQAPVVTEAPQPPPPLPPPKEMASAKKIEVPPGPAPRPPSLPPVSAPPPAAAPAVTQVYRQGAELDPPPRPLEDIDPEYPPAAGLKEGTVVLRLLIDATGHVDEVTVLSASPEGLFEASALAAFGKAKFSPGRYLGLPVPSQITVEVDYTPINRGGDVSGASGLGIRR